MSSLTVKNAIIFVMDTCVDKGKGGDPAYLHPISVMSNLQLPTSLCIEAIENVRVVALLHDMLEDYVYSFEHIYNSILFFNKNDVYRNHLKNTLGLLTRPKGVSYNDYIDRILKSGNSQAILVKYADMKHNMSRLYRIEDVESRQKQSKKYSKVFPKIEEAAKKIIENHRAPYLY